MALSAILAVSFYLAESSLRLVARLLSCSAAALLESGPWLVAVALAEQVAAVTATVVLAVFAAAASAPGELVPNPDRVGGGGAGKCVGWGRGGAWVVWGWGRWGRGRGERL